MDRATFLLEAVRENSFPCFVTASKGHHHSLFHDPLPPSSKPAMEHLIGPAPTVTPSSGFSSTFNDLCDRVSQVALVVKDAPANSGDIREAASIPGLRRSPGGRHDNPLQYSCLESPHGQRSLAGYSPWDHAESDTTEVNEHTCSRK